MIPIMLRMIKRSVFYLLCVCVFCIASMIVAISTFHTITHLTLRTYEVINNFILNMKKKQNNKNKKLVRYFVHASQFAVNPQRLQLFRQHHVPQCTIILHLCEMFSPSACYQGHSRVKTDSELWHVVSQVSKFRMRRSLKSFTLISAGTPMCYHLKHTLGAIPPACNLLCHVDVLNTPPKT